MILLQSKNVFKKCAFFNKHFIIHYQNLYILMCILLVLKLEINVIASVNIFKWRYFLFFSPKYNVEFYRQFSAVANALDNVGKCLKWNRRCFFLIYFNAVLYNRIISSNKYRNFEPYFFYSNLSYFSNWKLFFRGKGFALYSRFNGKY